MHFVLLGQILLLRDRHRCQQIHPQNWYWSVFSVNWSKKYWLMDRVNWMLILTGGSVFEDVPGSFYGATGQTLRPIGLKRVFQWIHRWPQRCQNQHWKCTFGKNDVDGLPHAGKHPLQVPMDFVKDQLLPWAQKLAFVDVQSPRTVRTLPFRGNHSLTRGWY